jgi:phage terminase large subunit-like protein
LRFTLILMTSPFKLTEKQTSANKFLGGSQRHSLLVGGSRSGKTFLLLRAIMVRALKSPHSRHAVLRFRNNAVWASIGLDTLPTVARLCFPGVIIKPHRRDGYFLLPNDSEIWLGGLDDKDRVEKILGQEYATILFNECSQIPYSSVLVALTRLAQKMPELVNRALYDLNPSGMGHWTYSQFFRLLDPRTQEKISDPDNYAAMAMNPRDNEENLDPSYIASLQNLPAKYRRRFFEGLYVKEVEGALWTFESIDAGRVTQEQVPELTRVVVAVDPSGAGEEGDTENLEGDEIGIVVVGLGVDGHGYVLEDGTLRAGPSKWGARAVKLYQDHMADLIVGETNFGGAMVKFVVRTVDPGVPFKSVTASRGKTVRAEPVAVLYGGTDNDPIQIHHVGRFPELEEQMLSMSTKGYKGSTSPDRADALVWGITELMVLGVANVPQLQMGGGTTENWAKVS